MYFFNLSYSEKKISEELPNTNILEKLAQIDKSFDPRPWSYNTWMGLSEDLNEAVFVLSDNDNIQGLAVFRLSIDENLAHLLKFLIIPDRRREGLGELLLSKAMEMLRNKNLEKVYLEVEKGNPAFFLYLKLGLKKIHEIADFYGPGQSALVMKSD